MKQVEFPVTALRICIDSFDKESKTISGMVCGVALEDVYHFSDSSDFLLLIDRLLDTIGRPQPSRRSRSFCKQEENNTGNARPTYCGNPVRYLTSDEIAGQTGTRYTFDVYITTRMKSSWQGFVKDTDGNTVGSFTSEIDFINLLWDNQ